MKTGIIISRSITFFLISLMILFPGCKDSDSDVSTESDQTSVDFKTRATYYAESQAENVPRSYQPADMQIVDILVSEYNVVFYRVEIGNSEADKFALWESEEGVTQNLASTGIKDFSGENEVVFGTYKYCRVTIGTTINLVGAYRETRGEVDVAVSGNRSSEEADRAVYLFGTAETGTTGDYLLTSEIDVQKGTSLVFVVNVKDTVTYNSGIRLSAPTMTFYSE
jgi:hypothetical protein